MNAPRAIFTGLSLLFQPLYALMLMMYVDQLTREMNPLAQALDVGILIFGVVFMSMQLRMLWLLHRAADPQPLRRLFYIGLVIWFLLEVVLSYWWCFVTGADPLTEHTPFVVLFLGFNAGQYWALRRLNVL